MTNEIEFVSCDPQEILAGLIADVEASTGETLYAGDVRRMFAENQTQWLVGFYATLNDTAKQALLRFATGAVLDALGEAVDTPRLQAQKATCTLQFTASAGHPPMLIPAGERVSPDGVLFFETTAATSLPAGTNTATVTGRAMEAGAKYNGFTAGQIALIIDPLPWLASVTNTTTSAGGADEEADGSSEPPYTDYRERIRLAPSRFSTAGPVDAYVYWAKTASANIADVSPTVPTGGELLLTILMDDGAPSSEVLAAVEAACSARNRRPLGDHVTAQGPEWVDFSIDIAYTINAGFAGSEATIRTAVEGAGGAVEQYIAWQTAAIGRAVNPDQLRRRIYGAGDFDDATRLLLAQGIDAVEITAPGSAAVSATQAARLDGMPAITYDGLV